MRAHDTAAWGGCDWTRAELEEHWAGVDLERDAWVVELGGRLAGYVDFEAGLQGRRCWPTATSTRRRVAAASAPRWSTPSRPARPPSPAAPFLQYAALHGGAAFFERRGYRDARHQWRMVIDLDAPPDVAIPAGHRDPRRTGPGRSARSTLRSRRRGPSAAGCTRRGRSRTSSGATSAGRDTIRRCTSLPPTADEIAGVALCDSKRNGEWGWVDTLGVRPAWRRRGIGEALAPKRLPHVLRARRAATVALQVDAQSPTGATRLYERAGMRVLYRIVVWEKILG